MTPAMKRLVQLRDKVDVEFLYYAQDQVRVGNYQALSHLAIIGNRMDALIERQFVHDQKYHTEESNNHG